MRLGPHSRKQVKPSLRLKAEFEMISSEISSGYGHPELACAAMTSGAQMPGFTMAMGKDLSLHFNSVVLSVEQGCQT